MCHILQQPDFAGILVFWTRLIAILHYVITSYSLVPAPGSIPDKGLLLRSYTWSLLLSYGVRLIAYVYQKCGG